MHNRVGCFYLRIRWEVHVLGEMLRLEGIYEKNPMFHAPLFALMLVDNSLNNSVQQKTASCSVRVLQDPNESNHSHKLKDTVNL